MEVVKQLNILVNIANYNAFLMVLSLRKPDCDIRIQLPQVSKEHCKIDLNENKEVS